MRNLSGEKGRILVVDDEASRKPNFTDASAKFQADLSRQQFLRPLPYDQNLQPKLARNAIAQAFGQAT